MYDFCFYFFMLFFFSILGWIMECIVCSINQHKIVYDRGFLIGPYCPIYGYGTIAMYLFLNIYSKSPIVLFFVAVIGASILEYLTSVVMEKMFKARWWDYSNQIFNLNGRICLKNAIGFGIIGIVFTYFIKPIYLSMVESIPHNIFILITMSLLIIFLIDNLISFILMNRIKNRLSYIDKDATSEIDKEVKDILSEYTFYFKRLFKSFPNIKFSIPSGEKIYSSITRTLDGFDQIRRERKKKIKEIKSIIKKKS